MQRKTRHNARDLVLFLVPVLLGSACANASRREVPRAGAGVSVSARAFEVPAYLPHAVIDQTGYGTGSEKIVIFSDGAEGDFEVRDVTDDTVVFTGSIKAEGTGFRYGRFTEFQTPGTYYVYTEESGASYAFSVGTNEETRAERALTNLYLRRCGTALDAAVAGSGAHDACHTQNARLQQDPTLEVDARGGWHTDETGSRDVVTACAALRDLLLSYELNRERHDKDAGTAGNEGTGIRVTDEVRYEIEWLIRMQSTQQDVYGAVLTGGNENSANLTLAAPSAEATIAFAGALAHYVCLCAEEDEEFASQLLARAESAWTAYAASGASRQEPAVFAAASELYRATGDRKYETVLSTFFNRDDFLTLLLAEEDVFYGSVTYLLCERPVNVAVRRQIRETLDAEAARMVREANAQPYLVADADADAMLFKMCILGVANYLSYRSDYVTVMENHMHYLYGRNPDTVNLVEDDTEYTYRQAACEGIHASVTRTARLVLLLYAIGA